jgi:4-amino-4-deoxy-L-arabinose transferase-like glycosyltransferase
VPVFVHQEKPLLTTIASPVLAEKPVQTPQRMFRSGAVVLALFMLVYVGSMFSPPLLDDADSTHAEAAREMYVHHDYVTLKINGVRYLEKAPLLYWMDAAGYHLFGVGEFASRLPNVLAVFGLMLLAWRWGTRAFGDRAGIYGALFVATGAGFYLFTRISIPDSLLSLFLAASLYLFLTALEDHKSWRWYAGYAAVALAVLTKGLVALVFVGATAFLFTAITREWRRWREFRLGTGMLLLFAIAAPWHILAGVRNPGFFWFYFINEHVLRFLGERYPKDYNKLPAGLYWVLHLVWLFPWSMYFPLMARDAKRDLVQQPGERFTQRTRLMCWIFAGIVLVFFAFSTNQEYYTFPAYLPLMMLLAAAISREEQTQPKRKWLIWTTAAFGAIAITAGIALLMGLWLSRHIPYVPDIGTVLSHNLSDDTLSMSHILDLSANSLAALRLPAILAVISLTVFPLLALALRVRRKHYFATWATAAGMALFLVAAHVALVRFGPYMSSRDLAVKIQQRAAPNDRVMIYGDQAFGSSLLFYLQRPIDLVNGRTTSMWFGSQYPDAPHIFLNDGDLRQAWNGGGRVFLFVPPQNTKRVGALLPEHYLIAEESGKVVYSNRP